MMRQVPFIGREDELQHIHEAIHAWGTRQVFCISGPGGIGKTRLLQEVRQRYARTTRTDVPLIVTSIIDFDDRTLHVVHNVGLRIAHMLGEQSFAPYLQALRDWRKMELAEVSAERLAQQAETVQQSLAACFNAISAYQRIVVLMDTIEAVADTSFWDYMLGINLHLQNVVILAAGRNAHSIGEEVKTRTGEEIHTIQLAPLPQKSSESYLRQKQELLHITLDPDLAQKVIFLTGGKPILLDLAVEWQAHEHPLPWLVTSSLQELQQLPPAALQQRRQEFERHLVRRITATRQPIDWLILLLARIYPLEASAIAAFLSISEEAARELCAQDYVFLKRLPDGRIALHDEMRHLVTTYVWPEVDPDGARQARDNQLAVHYFEQEIQKLTERMWNLETEEQRARAAGNLKTELQAFLERETLEQTLSVLEEQRLGYLLLISADAGIEAFTYTFDAAATRSNRSNFRRALFTQIDTYQRQHPASTFTPQQQYELDSRRVKFFLNDAAAYEDARAYATRLLERADLSPAQRIDMLIQRGNADIRLGHLAQGIADFEQAVQLSREYALRQWLVPALNALGWAHRRQGDYDRALDSYLEAYTLSLAIDNRRQKASILNNLAYVNMILGDHPAAFERAQRALGLWQQIGSDREIGRTYSTLGEISRKSGNTMASMIYYNLALEIFEREKDTEWISTVRMQRGIAYADEGNLEAAQQDLDWALAHGPRSEHPRIMYHQAQLHRKKHALDQALQRFEACRHVSQEVNDATYDQRSLADMLDIVWEQRHYAQWQAYRSEVERVFAQSKNLALRGSSLRKLADLAICNGDAAAALALYQEALPLIARNPVRKYTIQDQLNIIDRRLQTSIPEHVLRELGKDMTQFWSSEKDLLDRYPEALETFMRWTRGRAGQ